MIVEGNIKDFTKEHLRIFTTHSMAEFEETWTEKSFYDQSLSIWLGPSEWSIEPTPIDLCTACGIGNYEYVEFLIKSQRWHPQTINKGQWTALMYAVYYCHEDIIELLLSNGASLHTRNRKGQNALMIAVRCGYDSLVEYLIKCKSILEARDEKDWTALFHAVHCANIKVVQVLLNYKANPNACERYSGRTPLMYAAQMGDMQLVEILLRKGAFPGFVSILDNERTAAAMANDAGHFHIGNFINQWISKGTNLEEGPEAIKGRLRIPRQRLYSGSNINEITQACTAVSDLETFLSQLGLDAYLPLFREQQVDMHVFLSLTDKDLKECGVTKLGPRRKMTEAIARWHNNAPLRKGLEAAYALKLEIEMQELKEQFLDLDRRQTQAERLSFEMSIRLQDCHKRCRIIREHLSSTRTIASLISFPQLTDNLAFISAYVEDLLLMTEVPL